MIYTVDIGYKNCMGGGRTDNMVKANKKMGGGLPKIIAALCTTLSLVMATCDNVSDCIISDSTTDGIAFSGNYNSITINEGVTITPNPSDGIGIRIGNSTDTVTTLTNNGEVYGFLQMYSNNNTITTFTNNGIIYGILNNNKDTGNTISTLNNYGYIYLIDKAMDNGKYAHIRNDTGYGNSMNIYIANYHMLISEDASTFNSFSGYTEWSTDTSHLVIAGGNNDDGVDGITIDSNSKFIITIDSNFSLDTDYSLDKLITNAVGNKFNLKLSDQTSVSDLYPYLTLSNISSVLALSRGESSNTFQVVSNMDNSIGNRMIKNNISQINILRNQISISAFGDYYRDIYNNRSFPSAKVKERSFLEETKQRSYYIAKNNQDNVLNATYNDSSYAKIIKVASANDNTNSRRDKSIRGLRSNDSNANINDSDDFYYFFSPFVSYTDFYSGSKLSGISYGLVSGFNAKIEDNHTLGVHFGAIYGNVDDANNGTKTLDLESTALLLGLHYKLDLVYDIYIKAFVEGYFFMNDVSYLATYNQNPNSWGYGVNVYGGKAFNLNGYGTIETEVGISYSGIQIPKMSFSGLSEYYDKKLIHLPYIGIDMNYHKVFLNGFGFDLTLGAKKLLSEPRANMTTYGIRLAYDISTDSIFAYGGVALKYLINDDVELGLQYLGNIGDRSHSHTGFLNVRVWW